MLDLILLLAGFAPLLFGATLLVDSASSLARRLNIPNIVIGLTIVAFGTSAPELVVNIFASASGNSDITLGNIAGSNIFNILGILGISAVVYPLTVKSNTTWIEIPLALLSSFCLFALANDRLIAGNEPSVINRIDGIILLMFFVIFLAYNFQLMKKGRLDEEVPVKDYSLLKSVLLIIAGLLLLTAGGRIIVTFAVRFARSINIQERIIAITIVSIGTSLPELATSAIAARRKNVDIAIGNIVGSNIFNVFFILGLSAVIGDVMPGNNANIDLAVNILASALLFTFVFTGKGRKLERWEGIVFLALYASYALLLFAL